MEQMKYASSTVRPKLTTMSGLFVSTSKNSDLYVLDYD